MIRKLILLTLMVPTPAMAQFVRGIATDAATGARISGVNIHIINQSGRTLYGMMASDSGTFQLPTPVGARVRVRAERIGYAPAISEAYEINRGDVLEIDVRLAVQPVGLPQITVVGTSPDDPRLSEFHERAALNKKLGQGKIWTREDLEKHPPVKISNLLYSVPIRGANTFVGGCRGIDIFVDRLPIGATPYDNVTASEIDLVVAPQDVEGVEIYRGSEIPFEYDQIRGRDPQDPNPPPLCQLVLIWRKSYRELAGDQPLTWGRAGLVAAFLSFIALSSHFFWRL